MKEGMTEVNQDVAMTKEGKDVSSFCASMMSSTDSPTKAKNLLYQFKHLNDCEGYTCICNPDEKKSYPRATHNLPSPIDDCERQSAYGKEFIPIVQGSRRTIPCNVG